MVYAATHEGALHLDDILARRTRISIETWDRGVAAASEVAAPGRARARLGRAGIAREVEHYAGRVAAERESQDQPDDLSADAARLGARTCGWGHGSEHESKPESSAISSARTWPNSAR